MSTVTRGKILRSDLANWDGKTATATRLDATGGTITGLAIGNEVDVLQVYGSGANRTRGTIADAVQQIGTTAVTLVFSPGTWTIDDDLTIPSNFSCHIARGCLFSVSASKTLTFSGPVFADSSTYSSGSGSVSIGLTSDAIIGGTPWYKRTSGESSASVTPTNYQIWSTSYVNVGRYAADPSAVTGAELLNAIKSNDVVYIPRTANVSLSSTVTIDSTLSKRRIIGDGRNSIIAADANSFNLFTLQADDVSFENIAFYGVASGTGTTQYAVFTAPANPAVRAKFIDVYFGGSSSSSRLNNGILADDGSDSWWVERCFFDEMQGDASGTGYGVLTGEVDNISIKSNLVTGATGRGRHAFYLSQGVQFAEVIGNITRDQSNDHILFATADGQRTTLGVVIMGNTCEGGQTNSNNGQIAVYGLSQAAKIIGNFCYQSGENGILLNGRNLDSSDVNHLDTLLADNTVLEAGTRGLMILGTTRTMIKGNKIHASSQDSAGTHPNIRLQATAVSGQAVTDCSLIGNVSTGGSQVRADLTFDSTSPTPTGTKLRANSFAGGASFTIEDNSIAYDGPKGGSATITSGNTSVSVTHGLGLTPTADQISVVMTNQGTNDPGNVWLSSIGATTFDINCRADPGVSNLGFNWRYHPIE